MPLENEYILHGRLDIYCNCGWIYTASAYGYILHRQGENMTLSENLNRLSKQTKNRSEKGQKIAQSTHENGYIKPRKTFWRNSKQFLNFFHYICGKNRML